MKYRPSKKLTHGMLCQKHGSLLIKARSPVGIIGVWHEAQSHVLIAPDGTRHVVEIPAGVVVRGKCSVLAGKK